MKLNKDRGCWMKKGKSSEIEDLVYYLYLQYCESVNDNFLITQRHLIFYLQDYEPYYQKARMFIRKKKINKIQNNLI
jgi:hypothetical protein